jgi:hypothetical protein
VISSKLSHLIEIIIIKIILLEVFLIDRHLMPSLLLLQREQRDVRFPLRCPALTAAVVPWVRTWRPLRASTPALRTERAADAARRI